MYQELKRMIKKINDLVFKLGHKLATVKGDKLSVTVKEYLNRINIVKKLKPEKQGSSVVVH